MFSVTLEVFLGGILTAALTSLYLRNREYSDEAVQKAVGKIIPAPYDVGNFVAGVRDSLASESLNGEGDLSSKEIPVPANLNLEALKSQAENQQGRSVAALDGALGAGASMIYQYMAIDDTIYEGIGNLAGEDLKDFSDLSNTVGGYEESPYPWSGLSEGSLNKVSGHVAEAEVGEHFSEVGVDVSWPEASNQKGWDLLLNGHEVNVKNVQDVDQLSSHFQEYPDIPAVVPSDAENIPDSAVRIDSSEGVDGLTEAFSSGENQVIVDESLSQEEVVEQTADATEAALGEGLLDSAGIPLITLAFSGKREANLYKNGKTDKVSLAKNLGLDLAGTGGGAFAGAQAGTAAGGILGGPPGAVIGGLVGAVGGALTGRAFSNKAKKKPLLDAVEKFGEAQEELEETAQRVEESCERKFEKAQAKKEEKLSKVADKRSTDLAQTADEIRSWRVKQDKISWEQSFNFFQDAAREAQDLRTDLEEKRDSYWFRFRRCFFPTVRVLAVEKAIECVRQVEERIREDYQDILRGSGDTISRAKVYGVLGRLGLCRDQVLESLAWMEHKRLEGEVDLLETLKEYRKDLAQRRSKAIEDLANLLDKLQDQIRETIEPKIEKCEDCHERVLTEADKLGVELKGS